MNICDIDFGELATILSGFSTVAIAILTMFLYRENRLLRKAGSDPNWLRILNHILTEQGG